MGRRSRLSEEQWEALFDLDRAGVRRAVLAERFGVALSTLTWNARKRGRMKTQDPLAVDHRRRRAEGWPPGPCLLPEPQRDDARAPARPSAPLPGSNGLCQGSVRMTPEPDA